MKKFFPSVKLNEEMNIWLKDNFSKYKDNTQLRNAFNKHFNVKYKSISNRCFCMGLFRGRGKLFDWKSNPNYEKFLIENYNKYDNNDDLTGLAKIFNKTFKLNLTKKSILTKCNRLGFFKSIWYSQEEDKWLFDNYPNYSIQEITDMFNQKFNRTKTYGAIKRHCLAILKIQHPKIPIGTMRKCRNTVYVKLKDNEWVVKARYVNGLTKQDKDKKTFVIDDSKPITKENTLVMDNKTSSTFSNRHYNKLPPKLKPLAFKTCKLHTLLKGE